MQEHAKSSARCRIGSR